MGSARPSLRPKIGKGQSLIHAQLPREYLVTLKFVGADKVCHFLDRPRGHGQFGSTLFIENSKPNFCRSEQTFARDFCTLRCLIDLYARIYWLLYAFCSRAPGCTPARCGSMRMRARMIAARMLEATCG